MANTKSLSRPERKQARRKARKGLRRLYHDLSNKERSQLKKEKQGLKEFYNKKKKAEAEAKAKATESEQSSEG